MSQPVPPLPDEWLKQLKNAQSLPQDIPPEWLKQITRASRSELPEIPDSWLKKIKQASNPDLVTAVLSSSVLAALIALGSAALTAHFTNQGQERLEAYKLQLQAQNDKIKAYAKLLANLNSLASSLEGYLNLAEIRGSGHADAALAGQLNAVGIAQAAVLGAEKDVVLGDAVRTEVDQVLARISPPLSMAQTNPQNSAAQLKTALIGLQRLISRLNQETPSLNK